MIQKKRHIRIYMLKHYTCSISFPNMAIFSQF